MSLRGQTRQFHGEIQRRPLLLHLAFVGKIMIQHGLCAISWVPEALIGETNCQKMRCCQLAKALFSFRWFAVTATTWMKSVRLAWEELLVAVDPWCTKSTFCYINVIVIFQRLGPESVEVPVSD
jgi:hypothetical protein